jgi:hypothetical protein
MQLAAFGTPRFRTVRGFLAALSVDTYFRNRCNFRAFVNSASPGRVSRNTGSAFTRAYLFVSTITIRYSSSWMNLPLSRHFEIMCSLPRFGLRRHWHN